MTTYQDQPLQSRRAIRQGERSESSSQPLAPHPADAGEPLSYVTQNRPPLPGYDAAPLRGRRVGEPEPLTTEQAEAAASEEEAPERPQAGGPGFRPRDYSPEARQAPPVWAPAAAADEGSGVVEYHTQARPSVAPPSASLAASLAGEPSEQTLTRRELRALREAHGITAAPPTDVNPVVPEAPAAPEPRAFVPATPTFAAPSVPPAPAPSPQLDSALAEFDAITGGRPAPSSEFPSRRAGRRAATPEWAAESAPEDGLAIFDAPAEAVDAPAEADVAAEAEAPQPESAAPELESPEADAPEARAPEAEEPAVETPAAEVPELVTPAPAPARPWSFAPPASVIPPAPAAPTTPAVAPESTAPAAPVSVDPPAIVLPPEPAPMRPAAFTPPPAPAASPEPPVITGERSSGHWTRQAALDDTTQVSESTISRVVGGGSGAITTSALVLPSIPGQDMATGEIMLTDSVSLPANLAATGAHHSIDESDLDHLLDPGDHQAINTDSVPIRAIRAVSSHSGNRQQLIANAKPHRGNRALTALIVSASAMVVVVVTLLVVALVTEVI